MDWITIFNTFGFPVGLLVVLGYAIWQMAHWMAPRLDKALSKHLDLMDKLEENAINGTDALRQLGLLAAATDDKLVGVAEGLKSNSRVVEDNTAATREVTKQFAKWGSDPNFCRLPEVLATLSDEQLEMVVARIREVRIIAKKKETT
jgi:hypothetical protein